MTLYLTRWLEKEDENDKSLRNTVGVLDETLNINDIVRMHDDHTGGKSRKQ